MIDISSKFRTWLLEKDKWGLLQPRAEMCSDTLEIGFFYGYTIAQKDLQQKLDTYIQLAHTKSVELEKVQADKMSNDTDYLKLSSRNNALERQLKEAQKVIEYVFRCDGQIQNIKDAQAYLEKWKE